MELTPALLEEAQKEEEFTPLVGLTDFDSLMNQPSADAPVTPKEDGAA